MIKILQPFTYLPQGIHQINNEEIVINSSRIYLQHDNVSNLNIYTGLDSSGQIISGFTLNQDEDRDYKFYILCDSNTITSYNGQTVYCNYTSTGDQADDELFNELRLELIRLAGIVDSQSSSSPLLITSTTPQAETSGYSGTTVKFVTNKWLKKNQNSKLKVYSNSDRTIEVTGTVSMSGDDSYTFTASSPLNSSTMYYVRILGDLQAVDGSQLGTNYDFAFLTA